MPVHADQLDLEVMQLQLIVIHASVASTVLAPAGLSTKISRGPSHAGSKVEMALMVNEQVDCCISYKDCKLAAEIALELRKASARTEEEIAAASAEEGVWAESADVSVLSIPELCAIIDEAGLSREGCVEIVDFQVWGGGG